MFTDAIRGDFPMKRMLAFVFLVIGIILFLSYCTLLDKDQKSKEDPPRPVIVLHEVPPEDPTNSYDYIVDRIKERNRIRKELDAIAGNETYPIIENHREYTDKEHQCLAKNVYFEARNESLMGQVAVALVTLNRSQDSRFPRNLCDVAKQGGESILHSCQFSWYCDGLSDNPKNAVAYEEAKLISETMLHLDTRLPDITYGATHYHANWITPPTWATPNNITTEIGRHIFYTNLN